MDDAVTAAAPERILVISPYPPVRDGIAAYALQTVRALRRQGHGAPAAVARSRRRIGSQTNVNCAG